MPTRDANVGVTAVAVGVAALLTYLATASPTFYWLDSSELVAAGWTLGVAHPPGHPLASLVARLFCYLPCGSIAFRVTLASAVCAAAAAAVVAPLSAEIIRRLRDERHPWAPWAIHLGAALGGSTVAFSYSLWFQAVRAEVYALNLLLLAGALYALLIWDRSGDRRPLIGAALMTGLSLCNHHLLTLLLAPAIALFCLLRRPLHGARAAALGALIAGVVGLLPLTYLPLRAAREPLVNWGAPTSVERLGWVLSARLFQRASADRVSKQPLARRAEGAVFAVTSGLGPVAAMLSLGGLYLMWRRGVTRRIAMLLTAAALGNLVSPLLVGFDRFNPDAHGYLAVAVGTLAPASALFVVMLLQRIYSRGARAATVALAAAALALPVASVASNYQRCDLRDHWASEESARELLAALPAGSVLFTSYFETIFNVWAMQATADVRPDLAIVHRNFVRQPGYADQMRHRYAELADLLRSWSTAERLEPAALAPIAAERPIAVEYDLNIDDRLLADLRPAGPLHRFAPGTPVDHRGHLPALDRFTSTLDDEHHSRRVALWTHYLQAHSACRRGERELAKLHLDAGRRIAPRDRQLSALGRRCRSR